MAAFVYSLLKNTFIYPVLLLPSPGLFPPPLLPPPDPSVPDPVPESSPEPSSRLSCSLNFKASSIAAIAASFTLL